MTLWKDAKDKMGMSAGDMLAHQLMQITEQLLYLAAELGQTDSKSVLEQLGQRLAMEHE